MAHRFLMPIIISFLCTCGLSAQTKFFLEVSGTYSIPQNMERIEWHSFADPYMTHNLIVTEHYEPKPGIDFNMGVSKNIYKKFNLTAGIGISAVQFKRTFDVDIQSVDSYPGIEPDYTGFYVYGYPELYDDYPSSEDPEVAVGDEPRPLYRTGYNWLGSSEDQNKVGQTEIMYVNIPIGIQYPLTEKLVLSAGVKNSILTYSRQIKQNTSINGQMGVSTDKTSDGLSNNLLSADIGLQYKIFKKIWLSTAYNHYFTPVYDANRRMAGDMKYRTFRLGLKYDL